MGDPVGFLRALPKGVQARHVSSHYGAGHTSSRAKCLFDHILVSHALTIPSRCPSQAARRLPAAARPPGNPKRENTMQVPFARSRAFKHPHATHTALDVLGYRRNGGPIYAIAGGSGEGEGGSESGGQPGSGEPGQSGQGDGGNTAGGSGRGGQQSGTESGQSGSGAGQGGGGTDWEAKYKETLAHSREWEKRAKANSTAAEELEKLKNAQMTEQEKAVAAAEKAGRTAAAQESQAEIDKRDAQLRELTVRDAVRDRAEKHGAKASALLDSVSFRQKIADLDPSAKTFGANLEEAIKAAVQDNPAFAVQTAGKSGGDLSGGTGEGAAKRAGSLSGAIANHYQT